MNIGKLRALRSEKCTIILSCSSNKYVPKVRFYSKWPRCWYFQKFPSISSSTTFQLVPLKITLNAIFVSGRFCLSIISKCLKTHFLLSGERGNCHQRSIILFFTLSLPLTTRGSIPFSCRPWVHCNVHEFTIFNVNRHARFIPALTIFVNLQAYWSIIIILCKHLSRSMQWKKRIRGEKYSITRIKLGENHNQEVSGQLHAHFKVDQQLKIKS